MKIAKDRYKRYFDLTIIILAHVLLAPLWVILWIGIPLAIFIIDGRPILYSQERVGKNGKIFKAYKFRTMVKDADKKGPVYTLEEDSRVLPFIGKFLRNTGLDELPQLINIIKGDMSFVGPRPLAVKEYKECLEKIPNFSARECMTPGLTGLAQLYADRLSKEEWLKYDMEYAEKMSPWLDFKLMLLSVITTIKGRWDKRGKRCAWKN